MTQSYTTTETWSRTHARKVGGKVVADLRQMQQEYGRPTDAEIDEYLSELVVLLDARVLLEVTYGYWRNGSWIAALRYTGDFSGNLTLDDRSGRIPRGVNVQGAVWYSFLSKNTNWDALSTSQRTAIEEEIPIKRVGASAPGVDGVMRSDKSYSSASNGVKRSVIGGQF